MKNFGRVTKLNNISGRAEYITSNLKQENIVAQSPSVDWKPYQDFERNNQKTYTANNEGREFIIALPNEWRELSPAEVNQRAQKIAVAVVGKETDMQWAVHWNASKSNLHMHVIFSERTKTQEVGRYDRDVYHTEDGKVARSKAQRAKDENGNIKPPVHRKGEEKGGFTAKNPSYALKGWSHRARQTVERELQGMGVTIQPKGPIPQYHVGKGQHAQKFIDRNAVIAMNNRLYGEYAKKFPADKLPVIKGVMMQARSRSEVVIAVMKDGELRLASMTPDKYKAQIKELEKLQQAKKPVIESIQARTVAVASPMGDVKTNPTPKIELPEQQPSQPDFTEILRLQALVAKYRFNREVRAEFIQAMREIDPADKNAARAALRAEQYGMNLDYAQSAVVKNAIKEGLPEMQSRGHERG